jgi:outer membrane protein OmpA-like peptidoglycan-associated protein
MIRCFVLLMLVSVVGCASDSKGPIAPPPVEADFAEREISIREREARWRRSRADNNDQLLLQLRALGVNVFPSTRGVIVRLPDVLFNFGRADLTRTARSTVAEIARVLTRFPGRPIWVEGHADAVGTIHRNYQLSEDRARSVAAELARNGVSESLLSTRGLGESEPLSSNKRDDGRRVNRRVEVVIGDTEIQR